MRPAFAVQSAGAVGCPRFFDSVTVDGVMAARSDVVTAAHALQKKQPANAPRGNTPGRI